MSSEGSTTSVRTSRRRLLKILFGVSVVAVGVGSFEMLNRLGGHEKKLTAEREVIELSEPRKRGRVSIEEAIENRRSRRSYTNQPILLSDIRSSAGQLRE